MNQKITCKYCKKEFPMEEGLSSHLETIENQRREKAEKEVNDKFKKKLEKLELLENENKEKDKKIENINKQKETEIKNAVKTAVDTTKKDLDKENKEHYQSLYETKLKEEKGNLNEQNNEKQKLWELKEKRYIATVEDLQKKMTQGTTVDQGSSGEMQLGEFLKKTFKDKKDKISEYAKGEPGGDWLHEIIENNFTICKILYERKKTKNWSNE